MSFAANASDTTLIAPMFEGLRGCQSAYSDQSVKNLQEANSICLKRNESAGSVVDEKLRKIGHKKSSDGRFELGYTFGMPLLSYIKFTGGKPSVKRDLIIRDLKIISDSDRAMVLYLFSNHFSGKDQEPAVEKISQDSTNLMRLADNSIPIDKYFSATTYPWVLNDKTSLIDQTRRLAMNAILKEVCKLPETDQKKIRAVTTLGEVHHFFPNFAGGMGYAGDYQITDYGEKSKEGFKKWLKSKFGQIERLNAFMSSNFEKFEQVTPPSKNITKEELSTFFDHLDAHAHGVIPFFGWAYDKEGVAFDINVYLNGLFVGQAKTGLTRLDVAQAIPELNESDVGYRYDLDFSSLPPGKHHVQLRLLSRGKTSVLGDYALNVMDRQQRSPKTIPQFTLREAATDIPEEFNYWLDYPKQDAAVFYNPLAKLWNQYREMQVTREIETYAKIITNSCIPKEKVFSHQIGSDFNASWNSKLFAAEESLEANPFYTLGVNLYGGIIYSDYFFNWLEENGHTRYGVPEMHPMSPVGVKKIANAMVRHNKNGAVFISPYFMSAQPERFGASKEHDKFKIVPTNSFYGSSQFFNAIKKVMK
ncbi:hypothetical protein AVO41_01260 [Thiomicrospira sp. WB1]|nr:hypothetical protein AVO41_01260 [Thiomicrospira sp. WB1]